MIVCICFHTVSYLRSVEVLRSCSNVNNFVSRVIFKSVEQESFSRGRKTKSNLLAVKNY